jgi:hypothetical protein
MTNTQSTRFDAALHEHLRLHARPRLPPPVELDMDDVTK